MWHIRLQKSCYPFTEVMLYQIIEIMWYIRLLLWEIRLYPFIFHNTEIILPIYRSYVIYQIIEVIWYIRSHKSRHISDYFWERLCYILCYRSHILDYRSHVSHHIIEDMSTPCYRSYVTYHIIEIICQRLCCISNHREHVIYQITSGREHVIYQITSGREHVIYQITSGRDYVIY